MGGSSLLISLFYYSKIQHKNTHKENLVFTQSAPHGVFIQYNYTHFKAIVNNVSLYLCLKHIGTVTELPLDTVPAGKEELDFLQGPILSVCVQHNRTHKLTFTGWC